MAVSGGARAIRTARLPGRDRPLRASPFCEQVGEERGGGRRERLARLRAWFCTTLGPVVSWGPQTQGERPRGSGEDRGAGHSCLGTWRTADPRAGWRLLPLGPLHRVCRSLPARGSVSLDTPDPPAFFRALPGPSPARPGRAGRAALRGRREILLLPGLPRAAACCGGRPCHCLPSVGGSPRQCCEGSWAGPTGGWAHAPSPGPGTRDGGWMWPGSWVGQ